jgi:hypothetical protein
LRPDEIVRARLHGGPEPSAVGGFHARVLAARDGVEQADGEAVGRTPGDLAGAQDGRRIGDVDEAPVREVAA